ncbi:hypothetical protein ACFO5Q_02765 [Kordiimonas lipolytica]|uniref:DUF304 domain-containing protein n=1 Tax=Kordiimonas lipolytica TaxID=1662421 RepID=A0ABV8U7N3_9PROT|nr:hypothetical protein [Kordiimonas lipolytica]
MIDQVWLVTSPKKKTIFWMLVGNLALVVFFLFGFVFINSSTIHHGAPMGIGYSLFLRLMMFGLISYLLFGSWLLLRNWFQQISVCITPEAIRIKSRSGTQVFPFDQIARIHIYRVGNLFWSGAQVSDMRCFDHSGIRLTLRHMCLACGTPIDDALAASEKVKQRYPHIEVKEPLI